MADQADGAAAGTTRRPPAAVRIAGRSLSLLRLVIQKTSVAMAWLSGLMVLVLMGMVVTEVLMRKYFDTTLGGTIEYSEVLLVFIVFAGVAYTEQSGAHVKTDLLTSRLPTPWAASVRALGLTVAAALLFWATQATTARGWDAMHAGESRFGIKEVPVWPARLAIPVGLLFLGIETLFVAADSVREAFGREPAAAAPEPDRIRATPDAL